MFANRVIRCSGTYLRFICNSHLPLAELRGFGDELETHDDMLPVLDGTREADMRFLSAFFGRNANFLLGVEAPIVSSVICPSGPTGARQRPTTVVNGARAPNPRICFNSSYTSYLYDKMTGTSRFHIIVFGSDLRGPVRERIRRFSQQVFGPGGFYGRFGAATRFNVMLVVKGVPFQKEALLSVKDGEEGLDLLEEHVTIVYDDRPPDEDAHYWYGINHARGAVLVVRPDLWVGMSAWPEDVEAVESYFAGFLVDQTVKVQFHHTRFARAESCATVNGADVNKEAAMLVGKAADYVNAEARASTNGHTF